MANVATSKYNARGPLKVLWEWNGVDITQFGDGAGTFDYTSGSPVGTFSVGPLPVSGADYPDKDVLIFTSGTGTLAVGYYLINDLPALPERFIYRARVGQREAGSGPLVVFGMQDALHHFSFGLEVDQSGLVLCGNNRDGYFNAGLYRAFTSMIAYPSGVSIEADVMLRDPSTGVDPQVNILLNSAGQGGEAYGKGGGTWTPWGGSPALYDSSWQSGGTIRPALGFFCSTSYGPSWVSELQILTHPWGE